MVVGLGGVGSSCAEALARGVGRLILLDRDVVEEKQHQPAGYRFRLYRRA